MRPPQSESSIAAAVTTSGASFDYGIHLPDVLAQINKMVLHYTVLLGRRLTRRRCKGQSISYASAITVRQFVVFIHLNTRTPDIKITVTELSKDVKAYIAEILVCLSSKTRCVYTT